MASREAVRKTGSPVRSFVFRFDLSSPKGSKKPLESRETRNLAFQEDLSVVDNKYILVKRQV